LISTKLARTAFNYGLFRNLITGYLYKYVKTKVPSKSKLMSYIDLFDK